MTSKWPPRGRRRDNTPDSHDFPTRPYDLVKEFVIALVVVFVLSVGLAATFSSPDEKPITMSAWANAEPNDVVLTAVGELAGTTTSATYGPPYNSAAEGQKLGPLPLQKWGGVRLPVDSAGLVVEPLSNVSGNPTLTAALSAWNTATPDQRTTWATAYADAIGAPAADGEPATGAGGDPAKVASGRLRSRASPVRRVPATGPNGWTRRCAHLLGQLLRRGHHEVTAAALRRGLPRGSGPRQESCR